MKNNYRTDEFFYEEFQKWSN